MAHLYVITANEPISLEVAALSTPREVCGRAALTLDEAQHAVSDLVVKAMTDAGETSVTDEYAALHRAAYNLPEAGGTITLPDETVIKVVPVTPWRLASFTDLEWTKDTPVEEIVAAYNARKARS